jgi:hypothetical protein
MVVNDDAGNLTPRGVLRFIASKLAPTGFHAGNKKPDNIIGRDGQAGR